MEMCYQGTLAMPKSYAVMDQDEMMYVEGGKFYGVNLSKKQCEDLAYYCTVYSGVFAISSMVCKGVSLIPGLQAAIAPAAYYGAISTVLGLSGWFFTEAARRGGCYIGFDSKKKNFVKGYGRY